METPAGDREISSFASFLQETKLRYASTLVAASGTASPASLFFEAHLSHQVRHVLIHSFDRSIDHDVLPIPTLVVAVNDIQPRRKLMPDDVGWPRLDPAPMLALLGEVHAKLGMAA